MSEILNDTTYVGTQKVVEFLAIENTDKIVFTLDNGRKDEATMEQYIAMISPTAYPDGQVSVRKWKPFVDEVLEGMMKNDLKMVDKDFVLGQIESRLVTSANKATTKLWQTDDMMHVSLRKIDEVLKQKVDENKNEPSA
jgi:hypothetical protein